MTSEYAPKVGLILGTDIPEIWIDEFVENSGLSRTELEIRKVYSGPMAGLYLYLPQAVMIFLATAFLGPMLAEAGKDSYYAIKKASKDLWRRIRGVEATQVVSGEKKADGAHDFQLAFSINAETEEGTLWKLVLKTKCSTETAERGIDEFIDFISRVNGGTTNDNDESLIARCRKIGGTSVLTINPESGALSPADPKTENQARSRNSSPRT